MSKGNLEPAATTRAPLLLRCGKFNNFMQWRREQQTILTAEFGYQANVLKTNAAYVPAELVPADYTPGGEGPAMSAANIQLLRVDAEKARRKEIVLLKQNLPKMYAKLLLAISVESMEEIRNHASFEATDLLQDANALWRIIETHLTAVHGGEAGRKALDTHKLKCDFAELKMKKHTLADFKTLYTESLLTLLAAGVAKPTEAEQAIDFIGRLDKSRYGAMQDSLMNATIMGHPYPETLHAAWRIASDWIGAESVSKSDGETTAVFTAGRHESQDRSHEGPASKKPQTKRGGGTKVNKDKKVSFAAKDVNNEKKVESAYVERRTCRFCMKQGHIWKNCPDREGSQSSTMVASNRLDEGADEDEDDEDDVYEATFAGTLCMAGRGGEAFFQDWEVLLDTGAGQSVFKCRELLEDLKPITPWSLGGVVAGSQLTKVAENGKFLEYGRVGYCGGAVANILSAGEMESRGFAVMKAGDVYQLRGAGRTLQFVRKLHPLTRKKLNFYVCDARPYFIKEEACMVSVEDNMRRYTSREVKQAKDARELIGRLGHPSSKGMIDMIRAGIANCTVTVQDVRNADAIFGANVHALRGNTRKLASVAAKAILAPRVTQVEQVLCVDIMFIKQLSFLIGVLCPLNLTLVQHIKDRSTATIMGVLRSMMGTCKSRDFDVRTIRTDGEGGVAKCAVELGKLGVTVDVAGPGQHVAVVERKIQSVKAKVRMYDSGLPFVMCKTLLIYCVFFCVSRINLHPSRTATDATSSMEQFTGRKLDAKLDLRVNFGEYVQATVAETDNSMKARTQGCIACLPTGSLTGSVKMFCLGSKRIVTRDQFKVLPMPSYVIDYLTELATNEGITRGADFAGGAEEIEKDDFGADETLKHVSAEQATMRKIDANVQERPNVQEAAEISPSMETAGHEEAIERGAQSETTEQEDNVDRRAHSTPLGAEDVREKPPVEPARRSGRERSIPAHLEKDYVFNVSVRAAMRSRREEAEPVIRSELQQMVDKKVWHGVHRGSLSWEQKGSIIRSSMFLKDKFLASGAFDKFKARLVAGGDGQDKSLYESLSSPTVSTSSVLTVAAIAAHEGRHVMVSDIGGAFLNADMAPTGVKVHMKLDRLMTKLLVDIDPIFEKFVEDDGTSVVQLDKALYGCVEAANLWYNHLRATLVAYGMEENSYDPCVFNKLVGGVQLSIMVHVDDLMSTCKEEQHLGDLLAFLRKTYKEVKSANGPRVDYVGLTFDFAEGGTVSVTMAAAVEAVLKECGVTQQRATPATEELFHIREVTKATAAEAKWFHSNVAKMLYLAKRVRPECLTAVAFLSTRVHECDVDDISKLQRLLGYLLGTRERGIRLTIGNRIEVRIFIDAAYGVHLASGKSHTGCVMVIGEGGPVYAKSGKQKIVTKSSTEAELVAMSDSASEGIHMRNFLLGQGHGLGPVTIYQDNMSCLALIQRGRPGSERSRHINIRHFWLKERADEGDVRYEHLATERMFANMLTKPVQGRQFITEREGLTNWK